MLKSFWRELCVKILRCEDEKNMKKLTMVIICLLSVMILCCACGSNSGKEIIGYWMREDGYTISFVDESSCSWGEGALQTYKIYDKNHLQVVEPSGDEVTEYVFEVDGDILQIRLATEDEYAEFTKNADEQEEILKKVRELEAIALEEQKLQGQIDDIQNKIDLYQNEVSDIQKDIDWNNSVIENNRNDIIKWEEAIKQEYTDCQESIDFDGNREYHESQRDEFILAYKESIQGCNERIAELEAENVGYQEKIDFIMIEIGKLEKEIEELGF